MNAKVHSRRMIALLLALCMFVGLLPMHAMAAAPVSVDETAANVTKVLSYADQMRKANIKSNYSTGGLTWDTEKKSDSWRYFNGAMLDAFVMVGTSEMMAYAADFYAGNTNSDGSAKNYHDGEVDSVPMALGMFELLNHGTYGSRFAKAIEYVHNQLNGQTILGAEYGYNYWHKMYSSSWTTWKFGLDGLYMADVFEMEYANAVSKGKLSSSANVEEIYKNVFTRFEWVANTMRDSATGLYHHGWNGSNGNGSFWSRGIGWYAVALVDCIELMPSGAYKQGLIDNLPALFDGMLRYQDEATGMWYNVVNRNGSLSNNKLETSGSAMMAYALMKAYNKGWVGKAYGEAGLKAFNGVVNNKMSGSAGKYKVADIYQKSGVGTSDSYYTQNSYVADEAKGTAALIMAATVANAAAKRLEEEKRPEETVPETTVPEETVPEETVPEETIPETTVPEETVPEETVPEETVPEETVPEETVPEETEPEQEPVTGVYEVVGAVDAGYVYKLDTDGTIETGSSNRYLIVAANNSVALYSNGNGKVCGVANVKIENNTITLDHQNYDWYVKTSGNKKYITHDGTNELYHYCCQIYTNSSKKQNWTIESTNTAGQYRLTGFENWNWRLVYSTSNKNFAVETSNSAAVRMFKLTSGNSAAEVKFTVASKNPLQLSAGETSTISYNVLVGGTAASNTAITWSSDNASVAAVNSAGKVTAVAPGKTNIRATLTAVNGTALRESVTLVIPVTVRNHEYAADVVEPTCTEAGYTTYTCTICGDSYTADEVAALGHAYSAAVTAPTCTAKGYTIYTCDSCGDHYIADAVAALGHDYQSVIEEATCTEDGSITYTCHCGDSYVETLQALGHTYTGAVTAPTCTDKGYTIYTCDSCGDHYIADAVAALGHDYQTVTEEATCTEDGSITYTCHCGDSYVEILRALGHDYAAVVTEPTCTEGGYSTYTCGNCGDSYIADEVDALGHDYKALVTEATCTEDGYTTYTCALCNDQYVSDEEAAFGHDYTAVTAEPTCTEGGYTTHTCGICGDSYTDSLVDALGHDNVSVVTEATCEKDGYTTHTCNVCGLVTVDSKIAALGHDFETVTVEATCTAAGSVTTACTRCDANTFEIVQATGHAYKAEVTAPTCTEIGYTTYTCSNCGDQYTGNEAAALGHNYQTVTVEATCTMDGSVTYTCHCGDSYAETLQALGHDYAAVVTDPTCTEGGYTTHTCGNCADSYTTDEVAPLGHAYTGVTVEATCITDGYTTYTCSNCGDQYTADEVAAYGHTYESVTEEATCTANGSVTYTCDCGDSYKELIAALGHDYTCVEGDNSLVYTCDHCGDSYVEILENEWIKQGRRYVLDTNGVDIGAQHRYLVVGTDQNYALTLSGSTIGAAAVTINGDTITLDDASKYEFYFADNNRKEGGSYLLTQDGSKGVYHMGGNIYYGNDNKGYWHFGSSSNGTYQLYDYDNLNWYLNYGYVWGSERVSRYAVSSNARSVRLYKAVDSYIRLGGKIVQIGTDADGVTEASVLEKITIEKSNDGTNVSQTIAVTANMVTWDTAFDGTTAGTYTGKVIYEGVELGTVKVTLNPKHAYEIVTVEPTCTQQGYTCRQCSICGTTNVMEYTNALGHNYSCQEIDGYLVYTCSHCGDSYSEKCIGYEQVNAFANGSNYVITMYADGKYYALSHSNNQLSAVQVTVSNGAITSEIAADLLWNYNGNKLGYQSNGTNYYLYSYTNNWWGGWWGNTGATLSISNSNSSTVSFSNNALKVDSNYLRYSGGSVSVNSSATTTYLFVEK